MCKEKVGGFCKYLIVFCQFHTHSKHEVANEQGNGEVEVDKVMNCSEQLLATETNGPRWKYIIHMNTMALFSAEFTYLQTHIKSCSMYADMWTIYVPKCEEEDDGQQETG